ncbi:glycoside hydrolase family 28 protein [Clavulina sp. PMI_390]|nr:glycoside hydrolase family 28 protein [Clavulina sp. PMI_390]
MLSRLVWSLASAGLALASTCTLTPTGSDDAPQIIQAFKTCGQNGVITFPANQTFNIKQVMNTTGLKNTQINIYGTLLWDTNITYWLENSLPVGYQNQSTAWVFGGHNLVVNGAGTGTLDGNGQAWYNFVDGVSNYPGRPHQITIVNTTDSVFTGLRFVQSQMWTMTVAWSKNVLLQDIYVNSTSSNGVRYLYPARNTDGANTLASDNVVFKRWTIQNGDDSIAIKANSTNILIQDSVFYKGLGVAIGSIGQYAGQYETVSNVLAKNITGYGIRYAGYLKTWTGIQQGYPPNGGGAFEDFTISNLQDQPAYVTQCTSFSGATGGCDTSTLQISNVQWVNMTGTVTSSSYVAKIQCSALVPCTGLEISGMNLTYANASTSTSPGPTLYSCSNVENPIGFTCS